MTTTSLAKYYFLGILFFVGLVISQPGNAQSNDAVIAIIMDDLGDNLNRGTRCIQMPGDVTVSILPLRRYTYDLAMLAHDQHKEIMLHMPMQPMDTRHHHMGPGGLRMNMSRQEIEHRFLEDMASVPYAVGLNNHMGSLFTSNATVMNWLMKDINRYGNLYFVDSRTYRRSVANFMAEENNLHTTSRDYFLDHVVDYKKIEFYLAKLIHRAQRHGFALAIGHPHPETLEILEEWLPKLKDMGVRLVPVSEYIKLKDRREKLWRASLSPSLRAAKN